MLKFSSTPQTLLSCIFYMLKFNLKDLEESSKRTQRLIITIIFQIPLSIVIVMASIEK